MDVTLPSDLLFVDGIRFVAQQLGISEDELLVRMRVKQPQDIDLPTITLRDAIEIFRDSERYMELADLSKKSYDSTLDQALDYLGDGVFTDIKNGQLCNFLNSLEGRDSARLAPRTFNRKLAALRNVGNVLIDEKKMKITNVANKIKFKKPIASMPDYLTREQQHKALDLSRNGYFGTRNYTLFLFLLMTGARKEGVININWRDIDFKRKKVWLDEKNGKIRWVPLLPDLADQLQYYHDYYKDFSKNGPVFIQLQGNRRGLRITDESIRHVAEYVFEKMGFGDGKVHRTRKTFAMNCLEGGIPLVAIQKYLGHESLATTQQYLGVKDERLLQIMEEHFPFAVKTYRDFLLLKSDDDSDGGDFNDED
jgi:site-specific recombinase XerD